MFDDDEPYVWQDDARCLEVSPDLFFPESGGDMGRTAKAFCADCPVRMQCLEYALAGNEQFGVWGGLSTKERRALNVAARRAA